MKPARTARTLVLPLFAALCLAAQASPAVAVSDVAGPHRSFGGGGSGVRSDFDGDGWADLAIGVYKEDLGALLDTGAINVLYGSAAGLTDLGNQFWDETATGTASDAAGDWFGFALATGDFNDDGYADVAASAVAKDIGTALDAGQVSILYGSAAGLVALGSQEWDQNDLGTDPAETGDLFGWSLGAGDINGDGWDDLAVGAAGENVGSHPYAGAVNVLFGSPTGLTATGTQFWNQDSTGIREASAENDYFGISVAIGDFDDDGFGDLAAGVPGEKIGTSEDAGAVDVLYGTASGLTDVGDQLWTQDSDGINDKVEEGDFYGYSVATGDIDADGYDDLVSGIPLENIGHNDAGAASAIYGSSTGLDSAGDEFWHQDRTGIKNTAEKDDEFGSTLTIGDFDGDGFGDLAIGVPYEDLGAADDCGALNVIYGTSSGLDQAGDDFWKQDSTDIVDTSEFGDLFGNYAVVAGNFGSGAEDDVAIGVVLEDVDGKTDAGAVNVIYGSPTDLTSVGNQFWYQGSTNILDDPENNDEFGGGMAESQSRGGESRGSHGHLKVPG